MTWRAGWAKAGWAKACWAKVRLRAVDLDSGGGFSLHMAECFWNSCFLSLSGSLKYASPGRCCPRRRCKTGAGHARVVRPSVL